MGVFSHDFSVLACSWLAFVSVDDQISWFVVLLPALEIHEGKLEAGRETCATSTSETGRFDLIDDPVVTLQYYLLRLVPIAILLRTREIGTVVAVQVLKYSVLVFEVAV